MDKYLSNNIELALKFVRVWQIWAVLLGSVIFLSLIKCITLGWGLFIETFVLYFFLFVMSGIVMPLIYFLIGDVSVVLKFFISLIFSLIFVVLFGVFVFFVFKDGKYDLNSLVKFLNPYITYHSWVVVVVGFIVASRARLEFDNIEIVKESERARMMVLQGQLNPHVLFNGLNGLAELVYRGPEEAEEYIRNLSALLRQSLDASNKESWNMGQEKKLLENYLYMESLRIGSRLHLKWEWDNSIDEIEIIPLLLQPLVENAIKHSIGPSRIGGELVIIAKLIKNSIINIEIKSTGKLLIDDFKEGIGLMNVRQRLWIRYKKAALFHIGISDGYTVAHVSFPVCMG